MSTSDSFSRRRIVSGEISYSDDFTIISVRLMGLSGTALGALKTALFLKSITYLLFALDTILRKLLIKSLDLITNIVIE